MNELTEILRKVLVDKVSQRQICRDFKITPTTLTKLLENSEPPGYQRTAERPRPKLGSILGVIDQILADDRSAGEAASQRQANLRTTA